MEYSSNLVEELLSNFKNAGSTSERVEISIQLLNANANQQEICLMYSYWADKFNTDHDDPINDCPLVMKDYVLQYCPRRDISILDVCCGTGLGAKLLNKLGYNIIDGIDGSKSMLEKAYMLRVYRDLYYEILQEKSPILSIPEERLYDMIFCAACFCKTHLTGKNLPALLNRLTNGGILIMSEYSESEDEIGVFRIVKELKEQNIIEVLVSETKICYGVDSNFLVLKKI